jgi:mRNA interferase HicA
MKSSELFRKLIRDGWFVEREAKGSHKVMLHPTKPGVIIFPDHGSREMRKGTAESILKQAGLK